MEEIKRVVFTKKRVLLLVILVLYSTVLFLKPLMYGFDQTQREEFDVYMDTYRDMSIQEIKKELDSLLASGTSLMDLGYGGMEFYWQLEHIEEYPQFLKHIQKQADSMLNISIFQSNDETVLKTAADYKRMEGANLTLGHDYAVISVLDHTASDWLLGIYMVVIAFSFMKERKRGMWNLVCASPGGRVTLPLMRVLTLAVAAGLGTVLFTGTEVVGGWIRHGGADELNRIVQSVTLLKGFPLPMTTGQFWLFYVALRFLGAFIIGVVFWLFFEAIPDWRVAAIAFALFVGFEWVVYDLLPADYMMDTVNLFMWLSPRTMLLSYEVLNPFGLAMGRLETYLVAIGIIALIALAVILICTRVRKPNSGFAWLARLAEFWRKRTAAVGFHKSLLFHEIHKLLVIGRGVLVFLAALLICVSAAKDPYLGSDPSVSMSLEAYYRQSQGIVSDKQEDFLQKKKAELSQRQAEYASLQERYQNGDISGTEYHITSLQYHDLAEKEAALRQYEADLQALKSIDNAYIVPHWVYAELFGIESSTANTLLVISLAAVSLICILYSSTEASTGMTKARRATVRGRKQALTARYGAAWLLTVVICAVIWGTQILLLSASYEGLPFLNAPICCLQYFRSMPSGWSILGYWTMLTAGRTAAMCVWSTLLLWAADRLQK